MSDSRVPSPHATPERAEAPDQTGSSLRGPGRFVWRQEHLVALPPDPELDALILHALNSYDHEAECRAAGFSKPLPPLRIPSARPRSRRPPPGAR